MALDVGKTVRLLARAKVMTKIKTKRGRFDFHVYSLTDGGWYWAHCMGTPHGPYTSHREALLACKQDNDDFALDRVLLSLPPPH